MVRWFLWNILARSDADIVYSFCVSISESNGNLTNLCLEYRRNCPGAERGLLLRKNMRAKLSVYVSCSFAAAILNLKSSGTQCQKLR